MSDLQPSGTVAYDASTALVLSGQAQAALSSAQDLTIDSADMYQIAADELQQIKALQKQVEEKRTSITKPLNDVLKAVNALFKGPADYLLQAEQACKRPMIAWTTEQNRLAEVARKAAEEAARAERQRLADEQAAQEKAAREAEQAAKKAREEAEAAAARGDEAAAAAAREQERQQTEAAQAAQAEVEATVATAAVVSITPTVVAPAKVVGISSRVTYAAQVDDLMTLVKAVAEGKAPLEAIEANTKFLGAQARAFKKPGPLYPGVTTVAESGIASRAA